MSAGQEVGPLDREGRSLIQPPLPPDEATRALAAAAGISTVGLRPSFDIPAAPYSHPDCRDAVDGRTTRHAGYAVSQRIRKRIEEAFGWMKTVAGQERTKFRGRERVGWAFTFAAAAYNLARLPKLLEAPA